MRIASFSLPNLFPLVLLLGLLGMTARPATDPDLWWHLRTGQWIVETGHVPHSDPFSFTRAGHAWVSHEWLSEVVFFELWKHGGAAALIVFSSLVTTAGFLLLYLRCPGTRPWAAAATAFAALAAAPSWGVRPQMFTFALTSLFLWLIDRGETHPRLLLLIPPVFLLWINLHAGFALGPALLLAYGVGLLFETAVGDTPWQQSRPILLRMLFLLLACLALVPLNPSGTHLYHYPFDTLRSAGMRSFIGEWYSPDFHQSLYQPFMLLWLLLLVAVAISRSRPKGRVLVPLLLTSMAALDAVRHIPIFVLMAAPVLAAPMLASTTLASQTLAAALPSRSDLRPGASEPTPLSLLRPLFGIAVVLLMAALALVKWRGLARDQLLHEAEHFPQPAVAFLQRTSTPGNVFVYYDWGGYAIWKLYPQSRVFVDGRADLYGDDLLQQFKTAVTLRSGWQDVLDHWHIQTLLLPPSCALAQALLLDNRWHTAFRDPKSIVLLRTDPSPPIDLPTDPATRSPRPPAPAVVPTSTVTDEKPGSEKMFPTALRICETRAQQREPMQCQLRQSPAQKHKGVSDGRSC